MWIQSNWHIQRPWWARPAAPRDWLPWRMHRLGPIPGTRIEFTRIDNVMTFKSFSSHSQVILKSFSSHSQVILLIAPHSWRDCIALLQSCLPAHSLCHSHSWSVEQLGKATKGIILSLSIYIYIYTYVYTSFLDSLGLETHTKDPGQKAFTSQENCTFHCSPSGNRTVSYFANKSILSKILAVLLQPLWLWPFYSNWTSG